THCRNKDNNEMKLVVEGERRMSGRGLKRERRLFVVTMGQVLDAVGFGEILPRSVEVAFGLPRNAPVVEGGSRVRLKPDRFVEILQRPVEVPSVSPDKTAVVEGANVRLKPDRLGAVLQRTGKVPSVSPHKTAVVEGGSVIRLKPDHFI